MKHLRVTVAVDLPEDAFEQAAVMLKLSPAVASFRKAMNAAAGEGAVQSDTRIINRQAKRPAPEAAAIAEASEPADPELAEAAD